MGHVCSDPSVDHSDELQGTRSAPVDTPVKTDTPLLGILPRESQDTLLDMLSGRVEKGIPDLRSVLEERGGSRQTYFLHPAGRNLSGEEGKGVRGEDKRICWYWWREVV